MTHEEDIELVKNWIKKSKRFARLSKILMWLTFALGTVAIIISWVSLNRGIEGGIVLLLLGGILIIASFIWMILKSKWEDKVVEWQLRYVNSSKTGV